MKYLLVFVLFFSTLVANEKQTLTIGLGPYIQSQPYKDVDDIVVPSPVIFFDNGIFYMRWSRGGVYFLGEKKEDYAWGFSITAQPRPFGYKPSDAPILNGMQERKTTLEGGLAFSASYHDTKYIEIMLLTDILDRYDSWLLRTEIGDEYSFGKFTFYPSIVVMYQSQKFLNYYYGVTQQESSPLHPYYEATDGFEIGAQTYIHYPLYKKFSLLLNLRYDIIAKTAQDSPLVNENYIYSGLFSVIYKFEY